MGYRSEVLLAFDKSILPKFLDVLAKCEETKRLVFEWRKEWDKEFTISNPYASGDDDVLSDVKEMEKHILYLILMWVLLVLEI